MGELEERARALGRSLRKHRPVVDRDLAELKVLLPQLRAADPEKYGPRYLEETILGYGALDRGTISRWTAKAAGTSKKSAAA